MCNKVVDTHACALEKYFAPDCCKTQHLCNRAIGMYTSAIQFVPECFKTKEMCVKAVTTF